jgi:hypothetical protein
MIKLNQAAYGTPLKPMNRNRFSTRIRMNKRILIAVMALAISRPATGAINVERLADAIYRAEGGAKTTHPYGILAHYKYTTPRQACINTIKHAQRDWDGKGDFIEFLGGRYCPTKGKYLTKAERNLNKNWIKNVKHFYERIRQ